MNKKEHERRRRESAEREARARSESSDRRQRFKVLWDLDLQQLRTASNPKEIPQKLRSLKRQKLKKLLDSIRELTGESDLYDDVKELVDLAGWQDQEIEYLTPFRDELERIKTYYPEQLRNLSGASFWAEMKPMLEKIRAEEKPKQKYDRKRRDYRLGDVGEIEREFGGEGSVLPWADPFNFALSAYQRRIGICPLLDNIIRGAGVNMLRLQKLFGLNRKRFPERLPFVKEGREWVYDYRAVTKIMDALLGEKEPRPKNSKRGRPSTYWLSEPALRALVLTGIEARIRAIEAPGHIADAFTRVVRRHMPNAD